MKFSGFPVLMVLLMAIAVSGCYPYLPEPMYPEFKPQPFGSVPTCLQAYIDGFQAEVKAANIVCDNGTVEEYNFLGGKYYLFNVGTCLNTLSSWVRDSECNFAGEIGGLTRNNTIRGEDFSKAEFVRIVWPK
jgi:hypothetical protein